MNVSEVAKCALNVRGVAAKIAVLQAVSAGIALGTHVFSYSQWDNFFKIINTLNLLSRDFAEAELENTAG